MVVFIATSLTFVLLKLSKGDPYSAYAEGGISPAMISKLRAQHGYDLPISQQYLLRISQAARGDFGYSVSRSDQVSTVIRHTLPRTIWLMAAALFTSVLGGMAIGAWQGASIGQKRERAVNALMLLAYSVPEFWLATVLALVLGAKWQWFPVSTTIRLSPDTVGYPAYIVDLAKHFFLPWLALSVVGVAIFARYQRSAMREVVGETFVRTARAKGLNEHEVLRKHAFRVAVLPVLTVVGLWFPALLGGAVFVEQVFGWPGMGRLLVEAIGGRDYDLVSGCVIVGSIMAVLGSLLADIVREVADPRIHA